MKKLLLVALFICHAVNTVAVSGNPGITASALHERVVNVWEMSVNVEDLRGQDLKNFTLYAPICEFCKKRKTGFNPG